MKEQIIQLPDNFEIKEIKDGKIILVEKEKKLTYKDVAKKLFPNKKIHYYIDANGYISAINSSENNFWCENNTISEKQANKLLAINKFINVAKYLNGNWQPDWSNTDEHKYHITYNHALNTIQTSSDLVFQNNFVYFKSRELAKQAIEILDEETIRLALCTDY